MPKLILKQQEPPKSSWLHHYGSQLAYASFIGLLLVISMGILVAFKPSATVVEMPLPTLNSATDARAKSQYLSDWDKLKEMQMAYEQLAKDTESYDKSLILLNQAEMAWQHLLIMSEAVDTLGLSASDKQELEEEQAYLQDQWQARIHFSELRLERFSTSSVQQAASSTESAAVVTLKSDAVTQPMTAELPQVQPTNKYIAQPPAGIELPAGFCTLNSAGVCKPETSN